MGSSLESSREALFEDALAWLRARYGSYLFFAERDVVWTLQLRLLERVQERGLRLTVFNDYPMLPRYACRPGPGVAERCRGGRR